MKISIVTVSLNAEKYIEETIESVISQRGKFDIEYIIVDGVSTDNTLNIINNYQSLINENNFNIKCNGVSIKVISEKDNGMYDAIMKGFEMSTGDVLAYLNSDDYYLPNSFSAVALIFNRYPNIKWLTGVITGYNEDGNIAFTKLPYKYTPKFLRSGIYGTKLPHIQQESCFWRKSLMEKINKDEFIGFKYSGDFYLWSEFSKYSDLRILNVPLSGFRRHSANKSIDMTAYNKEFNRCVHVKLNLIDRFRLFIHKRIWNLSTEAKLRLNKEIINLTQGKLEWIKRNVKSNM